MFYPFQGEPNVILKAEKEKFVLSDSFGDLFVVIGKSEVKRTQGQRAKKNVGIDYSLRFYEVKNGICQSIISDKRIEQLGELSAVTMTKTMSGKQTEESKFVIAVADEHAVRIFSNQQESRDRIDYPQSCRATSLMIAIQDEDKVPQADEKVYLLLRSSTALFFCALILTLCIMY